MKNYYEIIEVKVRRIANGYVLTLQAREGEHHLYQYDEYLAQTLEDVFGMIKDAFARQTKVV